MLDRAADDGIANGMRTCAAFALHSLARIGAPELAVQRLEALATDSDTGLIGLRAAHTRALVDGNAAALDEVSTEFEAMGAILLAAEVAADAARAWRAADRRREASAAANRSGALAARCDGVRTPALALADEPAPLTKREREVALLAAQGLASKAIGEQLYLSVRTVDNHLQRVYDKLGVRGRDGLSAALGTTDSQRRDGRR